MPALPDRILANWRDWFGDRAEAYAADIADRAPAAIEAWALEEPRPMDGGEVALVLAARQDGREVVCKLNPPDPRVGREAVGLAGWPEICPELLATRDDEHTILMERLKPGTLLAESGNSIDAQLTVIGALARRLHLAGPEDVERFADSTLGLELLGALEHEHERAELRDLMAADDVVVHTDLHALNVLDAGDGDWRVIDPEPLRAAPEAEIWALMDATSLDDPNAPAELRRRLVLYCEAAGLDPDLAARWARLRARAEANLVTEGSEWRRELEQVADALGD